MKILQELENSPNFCDFLIVSPIESSAGTEIEGVIIKVKLSS